jgi:purine-binding chemotaxis protein CheW
MVDLVKIRKKAKAEGRKQKAEVKPAEPVEVLPEPPTQDSALSTQHSAKLDHFKEQAGTKREGFVDEVEEAAAAAQLELLTFVLAGEQYALDIEHIVEIVTPRSVTRVPNAEEGIVGIISLRGTIVTVVDARSKLRHPRGNGDHPDRRIIVVEKSGETLGFEVDRVLRVVKTDPGAIEAHPVVHASEEHEAIRGVFRHADALTILLDFDKLLA